MRTRLFFSLLLCLVLAGIPNRGYAMDNPAMSNPPEEKLTENGLPDAWGPPAWEPIREMEEMQRKIDDIFKESFSRAMKDENMAMRGKSKFGINMSVRETKTSFIISADLPGMSKEDIKVELKGHLLLVSGQRKSEVKAENERIIRDEQNFGAFHSTVTLPEDVNTAAIDAEYKNGVLTITMPRIAVEKKAEEAAINIPIK